MARMLKSATVRRAAGRLVKAKPKGWRQRKIAKEKKGKRLEVGTASTSNDKYLHG